MCAVVSVQIPEGMPPSATILNREQILNDEDEWLNIPSVIRKLFLDMHNDHKNSLKQIEVLSTNINKNNTLLECSAQRITDIEVEQKRRESYTKECHENRIEKSEMGNQWVHEANDLRFPHHLKYSVVEIADERVSTHVEPLEKDLLFLRSILAELHEKIRQHSRDIEKCKVRTREFTRKIDRIDRMLSSCTTDKDAINPQCDKLLNKLESVNQKLSEIGCAVGDPVSKTSQEIEKLGNPCSCELKNLRSSLLNLETSMSTHLMNFDAVKTEVERNKSCIEGIPSLLEKVEKLEESIAYHQKVLQVHKTCPLGQSKPCTNTLMDELELVDTLSREAEEKTPQILAIERSVDALPKIVTSREEIAAVISSSTSGVPVRCGTGECVVATKKNFGAELGLENIKDNLGPTSNSSYGSTIPHAIEGNENNKVMKPHFEESTLELQKRGERSPSASTTLMNVATNRICALEEKNLALEAQIQVLSREIKENCRVVSSWNELHYSKPLDPSSIDFHSALLDIDALKGRVSSLEWQGKQWRLLDSRTSEIAEKISELEKGTTPKEFEGPFCTSASEIYLTIAKMRTEVQFLDEKQSAILREFRELEGQLFLTQEKKSDLANEAQCDSNDLLLEESTLSSPSFPEWSTPRMRRIESMAKLLDEISDEYCSKKYLEHRLENMWMSFVSLLARKKDIL